MLNTETYTLINADKKCAIWGFEKVHDRCKATTDNAAFGYNRTIGKRISYLNVIAFNAYSVECKSLAISPVHPV